MQQPILYLFVGYPGAGKTTIAKIIEQQVSAVHLWVDQRRQQLFTNPTHSAKESQELYQILDNQAKNLLLNGQSVIFDTNFNYLSDRQLLRDIAKQCQAKTVLIWVNTPLKVAKQRATHPIHSDRNGYTTAMTSEEFDKIAKHLEPPIETEQPIIIDGTDINIPQLETRLGLKQH